jgi:hypothetical protein
MKTSNMAPQPLSITASGGKIMQMMALKIPMIGSNNSSKVQKSGYPKGLSEYTCELPKEMLERIKSAKDDADEPEPPK